MIAQENTVTTQRDNSRHSISESQLQNEQILLLFYSGSSCIFMSLHLLLGARLETDDQIHGAVALQGHTAAPGGVCSLLL